MNFQQHLMRHIWKPMVKRMREDEIYMIIKGKILTAVRLNDIVKVVEYSKEVVLTEYEVNRSSDLKNAIKRNWVEVIYDRSALKKVINSQKIEKSNQEEIINIAKTMAKKMAEEMICNSLIRDIAKQLAKEMVSEIKDNIKIEQVAFQQVELPQVSSKIEIESSKDIFVDFKDEEVGITANINNLGKVEAKDDNLSSSLEKIKLLKRSQNAKK